MEKLILDTLKQEVEALRQELDIVERRAAALQQTLERTIVRIAELEKEKEDTDIVPVVCEQDVEPEIEVELIVCDDEMEPVEEEVGMETEEQPIVEEAVAEDIPAVGEEEVEVSQLEDAVPVSNKVGTSSVSQSMNSTSLLPPVDDIRKAISLGDRFLFQRELFGGDGEKMNKTIDTLNKQNSLEEAMQFISKKFAWDKDSAAYELFVGVLKRRFS